MSVINILVAVILSLMAIGIGAMLFENEMILLERRLIAAVSARREARRERRAAAARRRINRKAVYRPVRPEEDAYLRRAA